MKKDYGISLARVCAMMMIVLCHLFNYVGISGAAQFFNVGVYVFLLISGWLYGKKEIKKPSTWLIFRWLKLCVPILIWITAVSVYFIVVRGEMVRWQDCILFAANLQGLSWVFPTFPSLAAEGVLSGVGHLWFVTIIFLCYIAMVMVKKTNLEQKLQRYRVSKKLMCFLSAVLFILLSLWGIQIGYFLCFFIGYFMRQSDGEQLFNRYPVWSVATLLAVLLRLIGKHFLDDTNLYNIVVVGSTHTVIAIWIFATVLLLEKRVRGIRTFASSNAVSIMDQFSFYIYITHYLFLHRRFGLKTMIHGFGMQMLVFLLLTIVLAIALRWISERIYDCCSRCLVE